MKEGWERENEIGENSEGGTGSDLHKNCDSFLLRIYKGYRQLLECWNLYLLL